MIKEFSTYNEAVIFNNLVDISNLFRNYKHDSLVLDFLERLLKHKSIIVKTKSGEKIKLVNVRSVKCFSNGKETEFDLVSKLKTLTVKKGDLIKILGDKHIKKNPDVDPFGEEDWDDIDESLNESNNDYKAGDIAYYYGNSYDLHGQRVKIIKKYICHFVQEIRILRTEYDVKFLDIDANDKTIGYSKLSPYIKIIKRVYTPDDPYGEEDWETNEKWKYLKY